MVEEEIEEEVEEEDEEVGDVTIADEQEGFAVAVTVVLITDVCVDTDVCVVEKV